MGRDTGRGRARGEELHAIQVNTIPRGHWAVAESNRWFMTSGRPRASG